jgi:hypothetical protein
MFFVYRLLKALSVRWTAGIVGLVIESGLVKIVGLVIYSDLVKIVGLLNFFTPSEKREAGKVDGTMKLPETI